MWASEPTSLRVSEGREGEVGPARSPGPALTGTCYFQHLLLVRGLLVTGASLGRREGLVFTF